MALTLLMHADGKLVAALSKRLMDLAGQDVYPLPVGTAHIFWGCANLKVCSHCL